MREKEERKKSGEMQGTLSVRHTLGLSHHTQVLLLFNLLGALRCVEMLIYICPPRKSM